MLWRVIEPFLYVMPVAIAWYFLASAYYAWRDNQGVK